MPVVTANWELHWFSCENQSHCWIIRGFQPKIILPNLISHFNHQTWHPPPAPWPLTASIVYIYCQKDGNLLPKRKNYIQIDCGKNVQLCSKKFTSGNLFWKHNCVHKILTTRAFNVPFFFSFFFCNSDGSTT